MKEVLNCQADITKMQKLLRWNQTTSLCSLCSFVMSIDTIYIVICINSITIKAENIFHFVIRDQATPSQASLSIKLINGIMVVFHFT